MTTAPTGTTARKAPARRKDKLGDHVARVVGALQYQVMRDPPVPEAISALARLRRGIGRTPGFDYTLERYVAVPDELLGWLPAGEPADTEQAVHDAVTLYALHQQSCRRPMHQPGQGLGTGVARLVHESGGPDGIRRRFAALGTASTYPESIYHLRSLVTMLRGGEIPLDYGLLADDLRRLRQPTQRTEIQAAWGRELFRSRPATTDEETSA